MLTNESNSDWKRERLLSAFFPLAAVLGLFFIIITRRAWLSDDAYITFRTVDNFIHGYGLTWNPGERVQAYTHPLWMFLLSGFYFVTHEIYFTSIFLSIAVSLVAVGLLAGRVARSSFGAVLGVTILALSNAFVDYSTSGLENPLTHLLLAVFLVLYFCQEPSPRRLFWLSLVASLAGVNRIDTLAIYAPMLLLAWWETPAGQAVSGGRGRLRGRWKTLGLAALAQAPLLLWELFSLAYYGFLAPNTAYAKLNTGVPGGELAVQGLFYFLNSIQRDPLTLLSIFGAGLLAAFSRERKNLALALGMLLYLLYIIKIGGDFMGGRYFTAPLLSAVAILSRWKPDLLAHDPGWQRGLALAVVVAVGLMSPLPTYRIDQPASLSDEKRINDERAWYFPDVSLVGRSRFQPYPTSIGYNWGLAARAKSEQDFTVVSTRSIGVYGFYAGPNVHIIDELALADPLLARLPAEREMNFFIGHFRRRMPNGYFPTVYSGKCQMKDESLCTYWRSLRLIVSGKILSPERWAAIWKINTGQLDGLINFDAFRYPDLVRVTQAQLAPDSPPVSFSDSGVEVDLGGARHDAVLRAAVGSESDKVEVQRLGGSEFQVEFRLGSQVVGQAAVLYAYLPLDGSSYQVKVPSQAASSGYDRVRFYPLRGKGPFLLASLQP